MAAHRGHNEGSIYERKYTRKNGTTVTRYQALLPLDSSGRRPSLGTFNSRAEARQAIRDAEVARAQGISVALKTPTVRQWFEQWLAGRTRIAYRTRIDYQHTWQTVFPYIGGVPLDKLSANQLGEMWIKLARGTGPAGELRHPMAATTLETKHAHVNAALRAAVKSRNIAVVYNPAEEAKPERGERREIHPFTEDEVQLLLRATKGESEYPIWLMLLGTGCRPSECRALRWRDIDFERNMASISNSLHREKGRGHILGPTKTKKNRVVELRPEAVNALRIHKVRQSEMRLAVGPEWHDDGYVFTKPTGEPVDENVLRSRFDQACRRAGIPRRTLKETRHTFATLALKNGAPVKVVSEALGHASVKITFDIYSHVIPGMQRDAFSYLDKLFESS